MTPSAPLLVTRDEVLLDDVLRLAAAAGTTLDVAHDTTAALRGWTAAAVVLVGKDLAAAVADLRPARRADVHVVVRGLAGDDVFRAALLAGAADVVELPRAEDWLVEVLSDAADGPDGTGRTAHTLAVVAGSGGAGATTFACALGLVGATAGPALLLDLDPLGPGVDRVVGLDAGAPGGASSEGARWDALVGSRGRLGSRSLRAALPCRGDLAVLTWPVGPAVRLEPDAVREVLASASRGHDLVVADLPRHLDEVATEVVARCDQVLVVVEPSVAGVASAGRVASEVLRVTDTVALVVRGNGTPVPGDHVAAILDLPLAAELPDQRRLGEHLDLGLGPVHSRRSPLARAARTVLDAARGPVPRRSVA